MNSFILYPSLGLKDDVPPDHPSMLKMLSDNAAEAFCAEGRNVDFSRVRGTCSKSLGKTVWSNSATSDTLQCVGIFELYDGANRTVWVFMVDNSSKGRIFRYDGSRDPVRISDVVGHSGAIEWAYSNTNFYSVIRYGSYMVFTDWAQHEPYCALYDATSLSKLISSGTRYKFRYLTSWQRRIIGAYSDQSPNGNIDIRYSNALPVPTTDCVFASGNQLYVPSDDPIVGIKRMGRNNCFVYCEDSINRLSYYPNYSSPFSIISAVDGVGPASHNSIIDIGNLHFFFNEEYGFCQFDGSNFTPISDVIEETISTIPAGYANFITGSPSIKTNEVVWTVPLDSSTTPNALLFYNYRTNQWRRKDVAMRCIAPIRESAGSLWTDLAGLGYTTWDDFSPGQRWVDIFAQSDVLSFANTDGHLYVNKTESDNGSDFEGYRIEPIFSLGQDKSLLLEVWFNLHKVGNYNIYLAHKSANTVGELESKSWGTHVNVSCDDPENAVAYLNKFGRYHQLRWGTFGENEPFSVTSIELKYVPQGRY